MDKEQFNQFVAMPISAMDGTSRKAFGLAAINEREELEAFQGVFIDGSIVLYVMNPEPI
jgi:hypothetical protein